MTFIQIATTPEMRQQALNEAMAELIRDQNRSSEALKKGAPALERLVIACEKGSSGQPRKIARFLGACWNGHRHFDLLELRSVDREFSDDMLLVLDVIRWGEVALEYVIPDGNARITGILKSWGMYGEDQTGQAIVFEE